MDDNESAEVDVDENMEEAENEESSNPRKRRSRSRSSIGNPQRKKQKDGTKTKSPSEDNENDSAVDNDNNKRRPSSNSRRRKTKESSIGGNDYLSGRNINSVNKPAEAGILTRIYVENFMCHRKLTVDLNRNINFIYGQNGSGKSAILAAIQICLGAGARRTNRARNLKDLVRKDTSSNCAKIRVTLLNKGDDSFEHDAYGDYITVERTIAIRGGYNGYKLYSANNVEQSRSKKDLDEMLDKLNIQVENPVAILDQEEAKKFLTGKAKDKYNFFMKATELDRLDNTYRTTIDEVAEMQLQAEKLRELLAFDKVTVDETKRAYNQHQAIGKLEGKKCNLEIQFAWMNYRLSYEEQLTKTEHFQRFKERAQKKREELTQAEAATQDADDPNDERRNRLDTLTNEADEMTARKRDLEKALKRATEPQKALARQFKLLLKGEERANRGLLQANQRLQAKRDEIVKKAGSAESDQALRNQRLQAAEQKIAEEKNRHNELKQAVTNAYNSYDELEPEVLGAREMVSQLDLQMRGIEGKIRSMESSSGNSLDIFGRNCTKVKRMVDKATQGGKFRGPVLGPLGFYCKIQTGKDDFASLAELAIGNGMLDRFVVFHDADRKLFQKIRNEAGCRMDCGVLQQSEYARYNVPEPPEGVETVATVLSIQNDLVFNCLVDNAKIETKALSRSKEESEDLLLVKDGNNRDAIRGGKIKEVYFLPKGDNWKVNNGNIQMISNTRRAKTTIGVDMTVAIEDAKNEYQSVKNDWTEKHREYTRLEHEHTNHKKQWNQMKRESRKNEVAIDKASKEIEDIKAEQADIADNDIDTIEEEEEVSAAQAHLEYIKENQRKAQDEIKEKTPEIREIKDKVDEITARNEMVLKDLEGAQQTLSQHYQMMEQQKEKIEKKRRKLQQYEELVSEHTEIVRVALEETNKYLNLAKRVQYINNIAELRRRQREEGQNGDELTETQLSEYNQQPTEEDLERIEIPENLNELKDGQYYEIKIEQVEQKIAREKERRLENGDDEATAFAKYARARKVYKAKKDQVKETETLGRQLKCDMNLRVQRWEHFREYISGYTEVKFDETLNVKGSSGRLDFDHETTELNLVVYKRSNDEQSQQNDVKSLSGGERSFATIALLLGLGESLETPFRVMDEFDVFLDPNARNLVIETLIAVAKAMPHRQFIFITPQDVSNVESSPMLKILQMKPPERRTVAGGQEQQTLDFAPSQQ